MSEYSQVDSDLDNVSEDEFLVESEASCRERCCHVPWSYQKKRGFCGILLVSCLAVLVIVGTLLGLYFTGFFKIPIECDGISPFAGSGGARDVNFDFPERVMFNHTYYTCTNDSFADSTYTTPAPGLYFFSLSIGTETGQLLSYYIIDSHSKKNVTTLNRSRNLAAINASDTLGKETIVQLQGGLALQAMKFGATFDLEPYQLTSWSGFRLSDMFEPSYVFGASRSTPQQEPGTVLFDKVNFNLGGFFNTPPQNGSFVAAVNGTYFFTFSTGIRGNTTQNVSLTVNDSPVFSLTRDSSNIDDTDVLSRSVLLTLREGDKVRLQLEDGTIYSSNEAESTFSGFLYAPKLAPANAWSVYLNHSWSSAVNGSLYPVPMNNILVNEGNLFNLSTSSVTVNVSGVYYVYASIGLVPNGKGFVKIRRNEENVGSVARLAGYQNGMDLIGRGVLVHAVRGDLFHLWEDGCPGCAILADGIHKQTTFTGFLVYATP